MMCDPEVLPLELQNHFLHVSHLTTEAGEWIPQYLGKKQARDQKLDKRRCMKAEGGQDAVDARDETKATYLQAWAGSSVKARG